MLHRDTQVRLNIVCLRQCLRWLLAGICWRTIRFRNDCSWTPRSLMAAALLWAWSDEQTLTERFFVVRKILLCLDKEQQQLATSYQAFIKILRRWTKPLAALLQSVLQQRMQATLTDCWLTAGYLVFAVDGSRLELPRTRSHEQAYSTIRHARRVKNSRYKRRQAKDAKKVNSPQLWLTTMWHIGTGLPWDWRVGPGDSSERVHLREMLTSLPAGALITADGGFMGYEGLQAIIKSGRHVLLRVGANVRLLKQLGYVREWTGTVYLWPDRESKRGNEPLVLRLVVATDGKQPVYLVTNILSRRELSDKQVIALYARRWGIELFYRHLKQTFHRRKLLSREAENAKLEITWSLFGLWAMSLFALVEAMKQGITPAKLSFAKLLLAFRRTMRDYLHPTEKNERLCERLRQAIIDSYKRANKTSRNYPRKKQAKPPGVPQLLTATKTQALRAKQIKPVLRKGLTA
ncbi:Transposase DDE domain protein [Aeoliella mucimassa]|uniref:Transposase DDE domain protein n=2 Tax=Aeoliella mucimassa TaxID=2527972 RepID=A0A518AU59_9BACT|nr:Transposase DDE domain protein [Aeoliella mucimassa]QDU55178.1 Transposase DDE domain protein [Aeoliella mucimassa]QDU55665.1 Transposase DDE domain protein [Aeoliella mucimassa]QDU56594.1 Transposase DDE domain protein [Aeoliella mucimassa]QDU57392.1 Transposase DDE domain protein [Aeoliella mucimassa]